jgi:two-component system LytT family sensor kinase
MVASPLVKGKLHKRPLYHVLFWSFYTVFWLVLNSLDFIHPEELFTYVGMLMLVLIGATYLDNLLLIPSLLYRKKNLLYGICFVLLLVLGTWIICLGTYHSLRHNPDLLAYYSSRWDYLYALPAMIMIFTMILFGYSKVWSDKREADEMAQKLAHEKLVLEKEKLETELRFLKAQINPHFLFNTLNSIFHLIGKDPAQAQDLLAKFSEMLRFHLYETNTEKILLENEMSYIRNYADMEKLRKGKNLAIEWEVAENLGYVQILPHILLTFVENAFKHVSNHFDKPNKVCICLQGQDEMLIFKVSNTRETKPSATLPNEGGIGLANVMRRLQLVYPDQHQLQIEEDSQEYKVTLALKI